MTLNRPLSRFNALFISSRIGLEGVSPDEILQLDRLEQGRLQLIHSAHCIHCQ
jgi:hypothetical protein